MYRCFTIKEHEATAAGKNWADPDLTTVDSVRFKGRACLSLTKLHTTP